MSKEISIADALTGQIIVREMNDEELAQYEKDQQRRAALKEQQEMVVLENKSKRMTALSKLEALGLDADDLKALGL